jgi:hypothetical protein
VLRSRCDCINAFAHCLLYLYLLVCRLLFLTSPLLPHTHKHIHIHIHIQKVIEASQPFFKSIFFLLEKDELDLDIGVKMFGEIDKDHNGSLTKDEFINAINTDPDVMAFISANENSAIGLLKDKSYVDQIWSDRGERVEIVFSRADQGGYSVRQSVWASAWRSLLG